MHDFFATAEDVRPLSIQIEGESNRFGLAGPTLNASEE
jgi:hypothetical protein